MKIIQRVLLVLSVFVILIAGIGLFIPSKFQVSRSVSIQAPAANIYPLISNFKSGWTLWNTFDDSDPNIQYAYEGPEIGAGSVQSWKSKKMGDGRMTMTQADPEKGVEIVLEMGTFKLSGDLSMEKQGNLTKLTWTDYCDLGKNPFKKVMKPVISMMIGKAFDSSLENIKKLAESIDETEVD